MLSPFSPQELKRLSPGDAVIVYRHWTPDLPLVAHVNQANMSNVTLSGGLVACTVTGNVVEGHGRMYPAGFRPRIYRAEKGLLAQIIAQRQLHQLRAVVEDLAKEGFGQLDTPVIERLYHAATTIAAPEPITQG